MEPQKTAVAPQKTAVAPQKTAVAPQKPAVKPLPPPPLNQISHGAEADIELVSRGGKQYALKIYHNGFHPNTKVSDALKHLGGRGYIADIYETGTRPDGREYELMEYIPAGSLARYDLKGKSSVIVTIILRIATALDACHRSGIIHKDVKPANILVKDTTIWDCVLADFGIADVLEGGKAVTRQSRTPIYAAPEIYDPARAKAKVDGVDLFEIGPEADFYSLGMTALCLWSGEDAFLAAEDTMAVEKLGSGIVAPQDMPARLRRIVDGLLKKNPSERWGLKDIENSLGGHWAVMHTLNPLADVRLNSDPGSKDYAMTGEKIGEFLNKVYMWQFADAKAPADPKLCQAIVDSFYKYEGSYMQMFFASKGARFKEQDRWMSYCCDWESKDNASKAGPRDEDTRLEISMMKTIKGFGFTPYYEFDSVTAITIDDLEKIDTYDKKSALSQGLKGWIAVQYHENPDADLSEKYAYEDLLEDYVLEIGDIDPGAEEYKCYNYAYGQAWDIYDKIKKTSKRMRVRKVLQIVLGILFVILPLAAVLVWAYRDLNYNPTFKAGIVAIVALVFLVRYLVKVFFHRDKYQFTYTYGHKSSDALVSDVMDGKMPDIGDEELLVEPLYYAFSDDSDFDSSLNGIVNNANFDSWQQNVKDRGKKTRNNIFIALAILLAASWLLPKPAESGHRDVQVENVETNE